jgi:potassium-dependent mechanosensitive channel
MRYLWTTLLFAIFLVTAGMSGAQITVESRLNYQKWLETAERAEQAIDIGRASNAALEDLRSEIVVFRELFTLTSRKNATRILTLQSQIDALGPVPESGAESPDIAALRERITARMNDSRVPVVIAHEAHNRANGLIGEIDTIIRKRKTKRLLVRGPSPLNPEYWTVAARDLLGAGSSLVNEIVLIAENRIRREQAINNVAKVALLAAFGFLLVFLGRHWAEKLGDVMRRYGGRGTGVWSFLVSILRVVLPYFGLVALTHAIAATGMVGLRGALVLQAVPLWCAIAMSFVWLSDRLYNRRDEDALLPVSIEYRSEARLYVRLLAVILIAHDAISLYEKIENISEASRAVVEFPVILIASLILLRLRSIGQRERLAHTDKMTSAAKQAGLSMISPIINRVGTIVGFMAPVLAAIGYGAAAEALIYPTVLSLALFSLILILNKFIRDIHGWVIGAGSSSQDSLFPALAGFVIALMSLPFLALIWGARVTDLSELWARFMNGFAIGDSRISPTDFLTFVIVFIAGYTITRMLQKTLKNSLLPKTSLDPGGQVAITSGIGYVGIFLSALIAVSFAGLDLSSLAIVAGALSVGIGFGLQNIVSNFVSGVILLIERPISEGDWIEVSGKMGYVRDISVRSTRIETFDRFDVIVPNADLVSGTVTNYTRGNTVGRVIVPVGVAYGTDTRWIEKILMEIANAHPMVLSNPGPSVAFQGFGASSLDFEIRAILRDVNWMLSVKSDLNHEIATRFAAEGIEIPFEQRDVWLRNPETLSGKPNDAD